MRVATAAERNLFSVEKKSIYSLSSSVTVSRLQSVYGARGARFTESNCTVEPSEPRARAGCCAS